MEGRCPSHLWLRLKRSKIREYVCGRPGCGAHLMKTRYGCLMTGRPEKPKGKAKT
jgi:hypothetical protein